MTIGNAIDGSAVNSGRTQRLCGTACGVDAVAKVLQSHSNRSNSAFIAVTHTDEDGALLRKLVLNCLASLCVCCREGAGNTHNLTSGLHLWTKD